MMEGRPKNMWIRWIRIRTRAQNAATYLPMMQVCNRILNLDPADGLAFHCKMAAMLQAGRFEEALKQMESTKIDLDLSFEQAYAHYRLNSLHKSLAVLDAVKNPQVPRSKLRSVNLMCTCGVFTTLSTLFETTINPISIKYLSLKNPQVP